MFMNLKKLGDVLITPDKRLGVKKEVSPLSKVKEMLGVDTLDKPKNSPGVYCIHYEKRK